MSGLQFFATNRAMETLGGMAESAPGASDGAKAAERSKRLALERGGYYFIDADRYMSDYFAQVESDVMPREAIVTDSKRDVFENFLAKPQIGRVVVCVHGFNVLLHDAITWFRILTDTMANHGLGASMVLRADDPKMADPFMAEGSLTAFIGFSWPSNGSVFSYDSDRAEATSTAPAFANLLSRLAAYNKRVSLLCHSMGNYMACNALATMVREESVPAAMMPENLMRQLDLSAQDANAKAAELQRAVKRGANGERAAPFLIEQFVMIAPDVERRHVTKSFDIKSNRAYTGPFHGALRHAVEQVTNVYSRFDRALAVSSLEKKPKDLALKVGDTISRWTGLDDLKRDPDNKWEMRLGSSAHPITAPENMTSLNATEIAGRPIDHSDHIDAPKVAIAIGNALGVKRRSRFGIGLGSVAIGTSNLQDGEA